MTAGQHSGYFRNGAPIVASRKHRFAVAVHNPAEPAGAACKDACKAHRRRECAHHVAVYRRASGVDFVIGDNCAATPPADRTERVYKLA